MIDGGPVGGQVWTAAGSPYLVRGVNGNLTVAAGEELRIEAGATVLFSDGYGRVLLTIDGKLTINGTAAAPATLQGETDASVWMGISIANEGAVIRITGAVIRNATTGITITRLADVQIGRTTFDSCTTGLSLNKGPFTFDSIIVRKNHHGVSSENGGSVTLANALFQGNLNEGLMVMHLRPELRRRLGDPRRGRHRALGSDPERDPVQQHALCLPGLRRTGLEYRHPRFALDVLGQHGERALPGVHRRRRDRAAGN